MGSQSRPSLCPKLEPLIERLTKASSYLQGRAKYTLTTIYSGLDISKQNLQLHLAGRLHDLPQTLRSAASPALEALLTRHHPRSESLVCEATRRQAADARSSPHCMRPACPVSVLNPAAGQALCPRRWPARQNRSNRRGASCLSMARPCSPNPPRPALIWSNNSRNWSVAGSASLRNHSWPNASKPNALTLPFLRRQAQESLARRLERDLEQIEEQLKKLAQLKAPSLASARAKTRSHQRRRHTDCPECSGRVARTGHAQPVEATQQPCPGWLPTPEKAVSGTDAGPSVVDERPSDAPFTWPLSSRLDPTVNSKSFTSATRTAGKPRQSRPHRRHAQTDRPHESSPSKIPPDLQ